MKSAILILLWQIMFMLNILWEILFFVINDLELVEGTSAEAYQNGDQAENLREIGEHGAFKFHGRIFIFAEIICTVLVIANLFYWNMINNLRNKMKRSLLEVAVDETRNMITKA